MRHSEPQQPESRFNILEMLDPYPYITNMHTHYATL